jgi:hypothetical protein
MSIYQINKGVSKPIVFRGLKAQYIAYLAIGLVVLLVGFAVLYICGLSLWIILPLILGLGMILFVSVFRLSHRFGEHGLSKHFAKKQLPEYIQCRSRKLFINLTKRSDLLSAAERKKLIHEKLKALPTGEGLGGAYGNSH